MAELKTKKTDDSVQVFLDNLADEKKRRDSYAILELMREVTGAEPKMWGESIIGFGDYHYKYASGREGDWFLVGFSPRKQNLTLYMGCDIEPFSQLMNDMGKFKTGKGCLYIKRIDDIHLPTLKELIRQSFDTLREETKWQT
jgi:hypothetical protein